MGRKYQVVCLPFACHQRLLRDFGAPIATLVERAYPGLYAQVELARNEYYSRVPRAGEYPKRVHPGIGLVVNFPPGNRYWLEKLIILQAELEDAQWEAMERLGLVHLKGNEVHLPPTTVSDKQPSAIEFQSVPAHAFSNVAA